jgi:hypothetical protein
MATAVLPLDVLPLAEPVWSKKCKILRCLRLCIFGHRQWIEQILAAELAVERVVAVRAPTLGQNSAILIQAQGLEKNPGSNRPLTAKETVVVLPQPVTE